MHPLSARSFLMIGKCHRQMPAILTTILFVLPIVLSSVRGEDCGQEELAQCAKPLQVLSSTAELSFATKKSELDLLCPDLHAGLRCIHSYTRRCMSPKQRVHFQRLYHGTNNVINELCEDGPYQEEFLRHAPCMQSVQRDYERCARRYQETMSQLGKPKNQTVVTNHHHRTQPASMTGDGYLDDTSALSSSSDYHYNNQQRRHGRRQNLLSAVGNEDLTDGAVTSSSSTSQVVDEAREMMSSGGGDDVKDGKKSDKFMDGQLDDDAKYREQMRRQHQMRQRELEEKRRQQAALAGVLSPEEEEENEEQLRTVCCSFQEYIRCSQHAVRCQCGERAAEFTKGFLDKMSSSLIILHCGNYGESSGRCYGFSSGAAAARTVSNLQLSQQMLLLLVSITAAAYAPFNSFCS